jgi:light-regulated signal transduction histidine kinase (bacteriophytochrome)
MTEGNVHRKALDRFVTIEQVLTILVANAAKYSSPGTEINTDSSSDSDRLTICVRDEGIGIRRLYISAGSCLYFTLPLSKSRVC